MSSPKQGRFRRTCFMEGTLAQVRQYGRSLRSIRYARGAPGPEIVT